MPMNKILLDTHVWIWLLNGDSTLEKTTINHIDKTLQQGEVWISAISLWELGMLEVKKRITLNMPCLEWIQNSLKLGLQITPLTPQIAIESCNLPEYSQGDPADRIIIATARHHALTIMSRDEHILSYGRKKHVSIVKV
ncbi:MAG: hypothetical protein A3F18_03110 [Legionellales bacterium RIFCSPHIGHO2_12_FULL_37_14]|nr:MAG: hypothetical protein A3F18_03110 [Legionellales bacterium RIFCSPHIGHO2_12_FULL_37_14]